MQSKRSIIDRMMSLVRPTLLAGFAPAPAQVDTHLWTLDRRLRMPGGPILPTRTTIVVLPGGGLLVISPPPIEAGGLDALDAIGRVEHVLVPNSYHHLNSGGFMSRYPDASFWVAPGLFSRVAGLPQGSEITGSAPKEWGRAVDLAILRPSKDVSEVALFHHESATLILTDLAFHMVRFSGITQKLLWRASGVPPAFGPSRTARMLLLRNRASSGPFLQRVAEWPFRRILVAHGDPIETDARAAFRRAFAAYLPAAVHADAVHGTR